MTEKNIDHLINVLMALGFIYYLYRLNSSVRQKAILQTQNSTTPIQKTTWEKISIVSSIIGAVGALLYGIVNICELFR